MIPLRQLHRKAAPILFLPLMLTAMTGVAYQVGRTGFGLPGAISGRLLALHEGRFLGPTLVPVYVLLLGLGLLGMVATGLWMILQGRPSKGKPRKDSRWIHRILAPIAVLPLALSATTGVAYRLGRAWFGLSGDQAAILMTLHQGAYFGSLGRSLYVFLVGVGLIVLLITGLQMTPLLRQRRAP